MSGYYLCDTCIHFVRLDFGVWLCNTIPRLPRRMVMTDEYEHPHEVCKHWRPKEDTDAD